MRFNSSLLACGLITASFGVAQAAPVRQIVPKGTVSFTAKAQHFSVWLPVRPIQDQQMGRLKSGQTFTAYTFVADKSGIQYLIVAISIANAPKSKKDPLDEGQRNFLLSSGATLQKREDIQLNGVRGREITAISMLGAPARMRIFETPNSAYSIVARAEKAPSRKQAAQINRVFDSFRILPQ